MKYSDWEKHVRFISKELNGQIKIVKSPSMGDVADYFNSENSIDYKNGIISIEQLFIKGDYENGSPEKLNIFYEFDNRHDFFLSINQRDYFDKIFGRKRIRLGDSDFDRKFTILSTDELLASKIFSNLKLRKLLVENNSIILNISTVNGKTKITIKNMFRKVYTLEEYKELLSFMKDMIDHVKG